MPSKSGHCRTDVFVISQRGPSRSPFRCPRNTNCPDYERASQRALKAGSACAGLACGGRVAREGVGARPREGVGAFPHRSVWSVKAEWLSRRRNPSRWPCGGLKERWFLTPWGSPFFVVPPCRAVPCRARSARSGRGPQATYSGSASRFALSSVLS